MAVLTATATVDMTDWNFANIFGGSVTRHNGFQYYLTGLDGTTHYQFTGVGLTYDGSNHLTGGTVTGYRVLDGGGNELLQVTGFSMAATDVATAIATSDSSGIFESKVFGSGDNVMNGSAGDDILTDTANGDTMNGGDGNDLFLMTHAGVNTVNGGTGDDILYMHAEAVETAFDGGDGQDTVVVDRTNNYAVIMGTGGITNVESLVITSNVTRATIQAGDDAVPAGATLHVDASAMTAGSRMIFSGDDADSHYDVVAGAGNDAILGGSLSDSFHMEKGGADRVTASDGDDSFYLGGALDANDRLLGQEGNDTLYLDGNYASGLTLGPRTIVGIDQLFVQSGHSYKITENNHNVASGDTMTVSAMFLTGSDKLTFDGSAERDGSFSFIDGSGNDTLTGGAQDDFFYLLGGGHNVVNGGAGDDTMAYIGTFNTAEVLDGGAGNDTLELLQDLSAGITLTSATIANFEGLTLDGFFDYNITFDDSVVAAGKTFNVSFSSGDEDVVSFDGSAELDGKFVLEGGSGTDTLIGGAQNDSLMGDAGVDLLRGGLGHDTYVYTGLITDSTSFTFDTVDGFDANFDQFQLTSPVAAIDVTVGSGPLNDATFDINLATAVDAAHLGAFDAVLFNPSTGDHAGQTFLIIDRDGSAGYTAGNDLVIQLTNAAHLNHLDVSDFFVPEA